ncbi:MAG: GSU3473 family protein [Nitrospirota bacterium]
MLITVIYTNGKYGVVDSAELNELIHSKKIKKILRSDGWCTPGKDIMRQNAAGDYNGHERRQSFRRTSTVK